MAATYRTSVAGGGTSGSSNRSVAITPANGDLLVVFCAATGNTNAAPTCSDGNTGGTYTRVGTAAYNASADTLSVFVRDALVPNTTSTTVTVATGSNTAAEIVVVAISGMTRLGAAAVRGSGFQANQASSTTPAPALPVAALTTNPTIVAVANGTAAGSVWVPPTNWTERQDVSQSTPTTGLEVATRDSGFTGTSSTTGAGTSASAFASVILELDGSAILAGAAALVFGGTDALGATGALAGAAALVFAGTDTLGASVSVAGTAALAFSGQARPVRRLTQVSPQGLPARRYGSFNRPASAGAIEGAATLTFGGTDALTASGALTGIAGLVFGGTDALTGSGSLAGAAALVFAGTDTLVASGSLAGTGVLTFAGTDALTGAGTLAGSAALLFAGTDALTASGALAGAAALLFTATAGTGSTASIAGTAALTFGGTDTLVATGSLAGVTPLTFGGTDALVGVGTLAGSAALVLSASAALPGFLAGTATLAFGGTDTLRGAGVLAGSAALTFGGTDFLQGFAPVAGVAGLVFGAPAVLTATGSLVGAAGLVLTATGAGQVDAVGLSGAATLTFGASGLLTSDGPLAGVAALAFGGSGAAADAGFPTQGGVFTRPAWSVDRTFGPVAATLARVFTRPAWSVNRVWRYETMPNSAEVKTVYPLTTDDRDFVFDFRVFPELRTGSTLTITSAELVEPVPTGLTLGSPVVIDETNEDDFSVPAGKGVSVRISGFADDTSYVLACKGILSNGRTLTVPGRLAASAAVEAEV